MGQTRQDLSKLKGKALKDHMTKQIKQRGGFFGELLPLMGEGGEYPKLQTVINRVLAEVNKGYTDPALSVILRKQVQKAQAGDTKSAEFLLDRAYGKPTQTIVQTGTPNVIVNHNVISVNEAKEQGNVES